jgi:hypothetical protein
MAHLRDLPQELLVLIYHSLESIDDVHHMARTCRKAHEALQSQAIYLDIMRSVIGQAPQHRYDLQLCRMLDLHQDVVERMQQNSNQLPATQPNPLEYAYNEWEHRLGYAALPITCYDGCCVDCLPDQTVCSILARYQGLRVLEDLWLERQLASSDFFSADENPGSDALNLLCSYQAIIHRNELFNEGEIPSRRHQTPETSAYTRLNPDQRGRFYSAVIYVWLLNEIRWVLTNFTFPARFDVQIKMLERIKESISAQRRISLLDELDHYAVFKFMYHHLLPVYSTYLEDKEIARLPFTFTSNLTSDTGYSARYVQTTHHRFARATSHTDLPPRILQLFLLASQTYFQPPDLIDLIARSQASRRAPYPPVEFPKSTVTWHRPSQFIVFPRITSSNMFDDRYKGTLQRAALTHINLIARSSFHQTPDSVSPIIRAPSVAAKSYVLDDHASDYFLDRALAAFEMYETPGEKRCIREAFVEYGDDMLWVVWWFANSEDKARAKMERWRVVGSASL